MKKFVSWSGGKDCSFALYKYIKAGGSDATCLLNMVRNSPNSGHRVSNALFEAQADMLGMKLVRENVDRENGYIYHFDRVIGELKEQGYTGGIFGDLYLESHKEWIEEQCQRLGITATFPLWGIDVNDLYREFVESGFKAKIIGAAKQYKEILGKDLTMTLLDDFAKYEGFDVCGENGEYHSFVWASPLYKSDIKYKETDSYENEKLFGITLDIA